MFGHCHGCGHFVSFKRCDIDERGRATCYCCKFVNVRVHECREAAEGPNSLECVDCGEWSPSVALRSQPRKVVNA